MGISTKDLMIDEMDWQELDELWNFHKEREANREPKHHTRTIKSEIVFLQEHIREMMQYLSGSNKETRDFVNNSITKSNAEIKKLERSLNYTDSRNTGIPREKIEQAKRYPFENLAGIKKGKALCPFHDDRHPSMSVKNNQFYCFGCGEKGDTISFVMKRDGLNFRDAVKFLNPHDF